MDDAWLDEILARPPVTIIYKRDADPEQGLDRDYEITFAGVTRAETEWLVAELRRLRDALHAHHTAGN